MKIRNGLLFFIIPSLIITGILSSPGCASIVPPLGGPRDTIPPRLITVNPGDKSIQFNGNKIVFNFDEYIDPKDMRTELIVSPVPKIDPIVDAKLRTLTVRIKDTLEPNTTYSLNFGNAIRDVNEGNILKNFTYVFSTGDHIAAGEFSGNVYLAASGKVDTTLIVMLHLRFDDSAVVKNRPRYITRLDSTGHFDFRYIQPGAYALYAMKDEGGSHKYLSKGQLFAFADSQMVIGRRTPPVTLYAYTEAVETKSATKNTSGGAGTKPAASKKQSEKEKKEDRRLQFHTNISNGEFDVLDTLSLQFATALKIFDSTKIRFTDRNFVDIPAREYHYTRDSTNKKFYLFYNWPTDSKFYLIAAKDFAQDSAGRKLLKIDTVPVQTKKEVEYGEVRIRIPNLDLSKNPVLQFVQGDAIKYSYSFTSKMFKVQLFQPGEYELRLLFDDNKNGKWDAGEFFGKHRQPERVITISSAKKKFNVKANWDNEVDITL